MTTSNTFVLIVRTVNDTSNRPPTAIANTLPTALVAGTNGTAPITLDGSASNDPDGDSLSYAWLDRGVVISTSAVVTIGLPVGDHLIALRVNDNRGGSATSTAQSVKVTAAPVLPPLSVQSVTPGSAKRGSSLNITVVGTGFQQGAQVQIGGGSIAATTSYVNDTTLNVRITIAPGAFTTARTVFVTNPDSSVASKAGAFSVNP